MADAEQDGPVERIDCPWCDGFGWLDADDHPTTPETEAQCAHACGVCNGAGQLCAAELRELRVLARDAAIILGGDCAPSRSGNGTQGPGSRWPDHARLAEIVGPDPRREKPTLAELERWHARK
jgi:hypothetical protein